MSSSPGRRFRGGQTGFVPYAIRRVQSFFIVKELPKRVSLVLPCIPIDHILLHSRYSIHCSVPFRVVACWYRFRCRWTSFIEGAQFFESRVTHTSAKRWCEGCTLKSRYEAVHVGPLGYRGDGRRSTLVGNISAGCSRTKTSVT